MKKDKFESDEEYKKRVDSFEAQVNIPITFVDYNANSEKVKINFDLSSYKIASSESEIEWSREEASVYFNDGETIEVPMILRAEVVNTSNFIIL